MSRITLAFGCFFKLIFAGVLPAKAATYLPEDAKPKTLAPAPELKVKPEPAAAKVASEDDAAADKKAADKKAAATKKSAAQNHRDGSLAMLALFQREGRLVDFLQEDIESYNDADIGAAVRDIHRGCRRVITEHLTLEPVMPGQEEDTVKVPEGFDPSEVRLVGDVKGEPPFHGVLKHHGWRVTESSLPKLTGDVDRNILAPAQVEVL